MKPATLLANPLARIALALLVACAALAAAWHYTPLGDELSGEHVLAWVEGMRGSWWAPILLALAYTPASLVMFPRPLLTLAAVIVFGPWVGFALTLAGVLLNTLVVYAAGRGMAKDKVERLGGARLKRIGTLLRKEGLIAVATVGLLPVAPFVVEALAFGALKLKLRHVLPGVALAMLPGTLATILLGDQVAAALSHERNINLWIVGAVLLAMAALAWFTRRLWRKLQAAAA